MNELTTLILKLPRDTEVTPEATLTLLSSLIGINKSSFKDKILRKVSKKIILEIVLKNQEICFQITAHKELIPFLESQLQSTYPLVSLEKTKPLYIDKNLKVVNLMLKSGDYYPIKTYVDFKDVDPLSSILSVFSKANSKTILILQFHLESISSSWQGKAETYANQGIKREDGSYTPRTDAPIIREKTKYPGFRVSTKIISNDSNILSQVAQSFNVFNNPSGNGFGKKGIFGKSGNILNIEELATVWHLPSEKIKTPSVAWGITVLSEPPSNLPSAIGTTDSERDHINFFATTIFKNKKTIFGVKDVDRRRHVWSIGKTGTGKSTLIANMAIDDIKKGKGIAIIDPHGDLCETILNFIPKSRIQDVIYFNPADKSFPISVNPLEVTNKEEAELVVSGIVSIFNKIFGYSWGPRLEYILRTTLLTLSEVPNATLKDIPLLLTNQTFRKKIVQKITDPTLKAFWEDEFEKMPPNLQKEAISPILNKVGQFVTSPLIRNVIGHPKSSIKLDDIMNDGKILIANLSQGRMGEDNAQLLGAMLITKLQLAAMKRVDVPEVERRDFYLYVDEFQNFATSSFIKVLSEARKYRLNLMLANQYMAQIPIDVQKAILGNAGTIIAFALGAEDARILNKEFAEVFSENDLVNIANFQVAVKLMVDGHSQRPFLATTLPLPSSKNENKEKVITSSRQRYGRKASAS